MKNNVQFDFPADEYLIVKAVIDSLGFSVASLIRLYLKQCIEMKEIPFSMKVNSEVYEVYELHLKREGVSKRRTEMVTVQFRLEHDLYMQSKIFAYSLGLGFTNLVVIFFKQILFEKKIPLCLNPTENQIIEHYPNIKEDIIDFPGAYHDLKLKVKDPFDEILGNDFPM